MIAIVIPYYKILYFEKTLMAIAKQTNKNFKLYIGDDASPENPGLLIDKYQKSIDIKYTRFENNLGNISLPGHWERCINLTANEQWIMILGDDDVLQSNVISSWYAHFDRFSSKTNLVRFSSRLISGTGEELSSQFHHPVWESAPDSYMRKHQDRTRSSLSEYIFSKEAFEKYKFHDYPLGWHSDDRAWLEFSEKRPIYTINDSTVEVRLSPASLSGQTNNLSEKAAATQKFLFYLLLEKLSCFNVTQRLVLIRSYERFLEKYKKTNFGNRIFLFFIYLRNYETRSFKKFLKRNVQCFLKHPSLIFL